MGKKSAPAPQEDPSVAILRERQIRDLAALDEEENRRIKAALAARRGVRAFRRTVDSRTSRAGGAQGAAAVSSGGRAATRADRSPGGGYRTV